MTTTVKPGTKKPVAKAGAPAKAPQKGTPQRAATKPAAARPTQPLTRPNAAVPAPRPQRTAAPATLSPEDRDAHARLIEAGGDEKLFATYQRLRKLSADQARGNMRFYIAIGEAFATTHEKYQQGATAVLAETLGLNQDQVRKAIAVVQTWSREDLERFANNPKFSWTHLKVLVSVPTEGLRKKLEESVANGKLTIQDLQARIVAMHGKRSQGGRPATKPSGSRQCLRQMAAMVTKLHAYGEENWEELVLGELDKLTHDEQSVEEVQALREEMGATREWLDHQMTKIDEALAEADAARATADVPSNEDAEGLAGEAGDAGEAGEAGDAGEPGDAGETPADEDEVASNLQGRRARRFGQS